MKQDTSSKSSKLANQFLDSQVTAKQFKEAFGFELVSTGCPKENMIKFGIDKNLNWSEYATLPFNPMSIEKFPTVDDQPDGFLSENDIEKVYDHMKKVGHSKNIYFTDKFKLTLMKNSNFSSKLLVNVGVQLGGHLQLLKLTTTSVVFGVRNSNAIINLNTTLIELKKVNRGIEGLGYGRATVYFINSMISMATLFRKNFNYYNKHLFFPFRQKIIEIFDDFGFLKIGKKFKKNYCRAFGKKRFFFI